jgi:hypothetical protein
MLKFAGEQFSIKLKKNKCQQNLPWNDTKIY